MRSSTKIGTDAGSPKTVTPPTLMPVSPAISSAEANESFATPIRSRTAWFTSSRVVASTTQAAYCFGSFLEATRIVFPAWSAG